MAIYKFLTAKNSGYYSDFSFVFWLPNGGSSCAGDWLPPVNHLRMCSFGYHYPVKKLWSYIDFNMWEIEIRGASFSDYEKGVAQQIRFVRHVHYFTKEDLINIFLWCIPGIRNILESKKSKLFLSPKQRKAFGGYSESYAKYVERAIGRTYNAYKLLIECFDTMEQCLKGEIYWDNESNIRKYLNYLKEDSDNISRIATILSHVSILFEYENINDLYILSDSLDKYLVLLSEFYAFEKFGKAYTIEKCNWMGDKREELIKVIDSKILEVAGEIS